ncbi:DUF2235 domain-containing protein [Gordonia sp. SL306]|uniref:DUF2235 domain-containing protein n=1 Tax=Gordonia sp. SL306 TaxID=2995145 RepID=UPI0022718A85|nr:DUF2235 domain-containing protein [Gordonia sp. SL306]WAC58017.1 DUF2235 domain-containing protein [Gordonia sp. SL306]
MTKRLIVCCDGTWNFFGQRNPTNVVTLFEEIAKFNDDGTPQKKFYVAGVGSNPLQKIRGGALGWGLSKNLKTGYEELVDNYEPGDEIFLFGFSRGAYTARSLAGFIRNVGILKRENKKQIDQAFNIYRDRDRTENAPDGEAAKRFRQQYSHDDVNIRFIGVWDTVGSLGIPFGQYPLIKKVNSRWAFHDTKLSSKVGAAYHALAIDEKRGPFEPTLWLSNPDAKEQVVEQVWFSGVHCNVGGGYANTPISNIPLVWMMKKASDHGLTFGGSTSGDVAADGAASTAPIAVLNRIDRLLQGTNAYAALDESRKGFYRLLARLDRPIGEADRGSEYVASCAARRAGKVTGYQPPKLRGYLDAEGEQLDVDFLPVDQ